MKILVLAQIPPPLHGQSRMVELFLDCLSERESEIEAIHLNFKFSDELKDTSRFQVKKCFRILYILLQMIRIRIGQSPEVFYYVPAPAKRIPLMRDYLTLPLARLLFKRVIYHWHAVGVGQWLKVRSKEGIGGYFDRLLCNICYNNADLSIVLSNLTRVDAEVFNPKKMEVVYNGIPDPCTDFSSKLLEQRLRRQSLIKTRFKSPDNNAEKQLTIRILFLSLCTKEKGLFDALTALEILAEAFLNEGKGIAIRFDVAGTFPDKKVKEEFLQRIQNQNVVTVILHDFVDGKKKDALFREADAMVYPSYYENEGFPLVLIEALAYGLPIAASNWRGIPELLGEDYPFLATISNPEAIAEKLCLQMVDAEFLNLRKRFEQLFTEAVFKNRILEILGIYKIDK